MQKRLNFHIILCSLSEKKFMVLKNRIFPEKKGTSFCRICLGQGDPDRGRTWWWRNYFSQSPFAPWSAVKAPFTLAPGNAQATGCYCGISKSNCSFSLYHWFRTTKTFLSSTTSYSLSTSISTCNAVLFWTYLAVKIHVCSLPARSFVCYQHFLELTRFFLIFCTKMQSGNAQNVTEPDFRKKYFAQRPWWLRGPLWWHLLPFSQCFAITLLRFDIWQSFFILKAKYWWWIICALHNKSSMIANKDSVKVLWHPIFAYPITCPKTNY